MKSTRAEKLRCVCVCEREREREREVIKGGFGDKERDGKTLLCKDGMLIKGGLLRARSNNLLLRFLNIYNSHSSSSGIM